MKIVELEKIINNAFEDLQNISEKSDTKILNAINETIELTDKGEVRVANKENGKWTVNQWVKKAILLSFRVNKMTMSKGPYTTWYDKVPGKSVNWNEEDWKTAGYRHVPNGVVRKGSFIGKNVVLHPGVVIGADGFGFALDDEEWLKIPHIGSVTLGDDVEVGANSTIDRGVIENTVVCDGVKIEGNTELKDVIKYLTFL